MSDASATFLDGRVTLYQGDCLDVLAQLPDCSIDSVVTDPPYALVSIVKRFGKAGAAPAKEGKTGAYARASRGFMGKQWDTGERAFAVEFWAEVYRVLKPGGHVVSMGGTRTYHRMAVAIEDAGFEIRDQLAWAYGSGFPKSHDVSKAIDKHLGAEREIVGQYTQGFRAEGSGIEGWQRPGHAVHGAITAPATPAAREWKGWGTALKPAWEPICLARKPLIGTVAENVLEHGTGALNIDGCRVGMPNGETVATGFAKSKASGVNDVHEGWKRPWQEDGEYHAAKIEAAIDRTNQLGRWPANIVHDGSDEVVACFPETTSGTGAVKRASSSSENGNSGAAYGAESRRSGTPMISYGGSGSAARFFYTAKADAEDRIGSKHPTVKPLDLMQWLVRLVTPKGGTVLDPFAGTGTTGEAAWREGMRCILIEREEEYQADIARRMKLALASDRERKAARLEAHGVPAIEEAPLFGALAQEEHA